jgi:hypothetical protein
MATLTADVTDVQRTFTVTDPGSPRVGAYYAIEDEVIALAGFCGGGYVGADWVVDETCWYVARGIEGTLAAAHLADATVTEFDVTAGGGGVSNPLTEDLVVGTGGSITGAAGGEFVPGQDVVVTGGSGNAGGAAGAILTVGGGGEEGPPGIITATSGDGQASLSVVGAPAGVIMHATLGDPEVIYALFVAGSVLAQSTGTATDLAISAGEGFTDLPGKSVLINGGGGDDGNDPGASITVGGGDGAGNAGAITFSHAGPVIPLTTPDVQDVIDALVALGLVSQSD